MLNKKANKEDLTYAIMYKYNNLPVNAEEITKHYEKLKKEIINDATESILFDDEDEKQKLKARLIDLKSKLDALLELERLPFSYATEIYWDGTLSLENALNNINNIDRIIQGSQNENDEDGVADDLGGRVRGDV